MEKDVDIDLVFVGIPSSESDVLEPLFKKYKNHVFHYQNISQEALVQLIRTCDMFVLPSNRGIMGIGIFRGLDAKETCNWGVRSMLRRGISQEWNKWFHGSVFR